LIKVSLFGCLVPRLFACWRAKLLNIVVVEANAESQMRILNTNERWQGQWRRANGTTRSPRRVGAVAQGADILDVETEAELITRWRESRDQAAGTRLVQCYQRLIRKIARRYRGFEPAVPDLIAEGNVGLLQALERFDPARGFRLSTYAIWWIRAAMTDAILNGSIVKAATSEEAKRLFFNLRRAKMKLGEVGAGDLPPDSVATIARELAVSESEVVRMNRWLGGRDVSLNAPVSRSADSGDELQDLLTDAHQDDEARIIRDDERRKRVAMVTAALATLSERERHIVTERWLKDEPRTLAELGGKYGLTRERVRQIEANALAKIKRKVQNSGLATDRDAARCSG
jgi:RNA polymerase sigma-32 factor